MQDKKEMKIYIFGIQKKTATTVVEIWRWAKPSLVCVETYYCI